jgi:hypothetical protein
MGATLLLSRSFLPKRAFFVIGGLPFPVLILGGCEQLFPTSEGLTGAGDKGGVLSSSSLGALIFIGTKATVCVGDKVSWGPFFGRDSRLLLRSVVFLRGAFGRELLLWN